MAPRYATLRDYLRVVRQRRLLIIVCTAVFGIAALLLAISQDNKYRTSSSLRFTDPNQVLSSVTQTAIPANQLPIVAVQKAVDVTSPDIARAVRRKVGDTAPITVRAFDEPRTSLVTIEISSSNRKDAAKWANAWAVEAKRSTTADARAQFRKAAAALRRTRTRLGNSPTDQSTRAALTERAATLESAAALVSPAQIVRRARVPASPYAPNRLRDVIVGLLIGLTVGLIAAFVRDALDRRVRRPMEIESDLQAPVLGHIYSGAMRGAPFVVNGREPHRSLLPGAKRRAEETALEGFQILRTNLESFDSDGAQTVIVTSALAGEGKSTVSVGLAGAAALTGRMTLLVECDLRKPSLDKKLQIDRSPGLSEYLAGEAGPNDVLRVVSLAHGPDGSGELVVIPAGAPREDSSKLFGSERFEQFLDQVRSNYDFIVLDTGPVLSVADPREIARHVDAVLLCVRAAHTTRDQARAAKQALDQVSQRPAGVVVTDVDPGEDEAHGYYSYGYS